MSYTRTAYNGVNLMQIFAANTILQRKMPDSDPEIMMMTVPYRAPLFTTSSYKIAVSYFMSFWVIISVMPLVLYTTYRMAYEKETKMKQTLIANGLNPVIHFLSWLIHYTVINGVLSLLVVLCIKFSVFKNDGFILLYIVVFCGY